MTDTLLKAVELTRHYEVRRGWFGAKGTVRAVDGVSFSLKPKRTLALVGESGCGKSTLARMVTLLEAPTGGELIIDGSSAPVFRKGPGRELRRAVQMVFQNPYGSLNPRKTIGAALQEPLAINRMGTGRDRIDAARAMLGKVGLRADAFGRYPHMFSGGQRQRIAIGRALMLNPRIVVADEPVSALDVSIQAQVLNLLMDLQEELGVAYLFISHDLNVVRHIAHEVMVMYLGRIVERAGKQELFSTPRHPYTRMLLAATPSLDPGQRADPDAITGELPSPLAPPPGCAFSPRCPFAIAVCREERPLLRLVGDSEVACHRADTI